MTACAKAVIRTTVLVDTVQMQPTSTAIDILPRTLSFWMAARLTGHQTVAGLIMTMQSTDQIKLYYISSSHTSLVRNQAWAESDFSSQI